MAPQPNASQRGTNILGSRIKTARLRLSPRVTQADLAARLGVLGLDLDRPTVTRVESGKRFLRDYEIKKIAKALKVSVAWLFNEGS